MRKFVLVFAIALTWLLTLLPVNAAIFDDHQLIDISSRQKLEQVNQDKFAFSILVLIEEDLNYSDAVKKTNADVEQAGKSLLERMVQEDNPKSMAIVVVGDRAGKDGLTPFLRYFVSDGLSEYLSRGQLNSYYHKFVAQKEQGDWNQGLVNFVQSATTDVNNYISPSIVLLFIVLGIIVLLLIIIVSFGGSSGSSGSYRSSGSSGSNGDYYYYDSGSGGGGGFSDGD